MSSNHLVVLIAVLLTPVTALSQPLVRDKILEMSMRISTLEEEVRQLQAQFKMAMIRIDELEDDRRGSRDLAAWDEQANEPAAAGDAPAPTIIVKIQTVTQSNISDLRSRLTRAIEDRDADKYRLEQARDRLTNVSKWNKPDNATSARLQSRVAEAERELDRSRERVLRLERQIDDDKSSLIISAQTADHQPVRISAKSDAYRMAQTLVPGRWYAIAGHRFERMGMIHIRFAGAAAVDPPAVDDEGE